MASQLTAPRRHRGSPSRLRPVVVALAAASLLGLGWAALGGGVGTAAPADPGGGAGRAWSREARPAGEQARLPGEPARSVAVEVLREWDEERAAAYASGSVGELRDLYVGSAGASDVDLLRSYLRRGYRVEGIRMQLLTVSVRAHRPGSWLLRVTDRLAGGVAVGYGERVALPRDRASVRMVRLVRGADGRWRVRSVRG